MKQHNCIVLLNLGVYQFERQRQLGLKRRIKNLSYKAKSILKNVDSSIISKKTGFSIGYVDSVKNGSLRGCETFYKMVLEVNL